MKISLKNSGVLNGGAAIPPTSAHMEFGELAINYSSTDPSIFIKDSAGAIRRLVGVGNISFDNYQAIIPVVSTSPANVAQGNLYWDTGNERLYIYNGTAWKTATTLPFNEATIPDVTNASDQSGTFDDRYLRKTGGSVTGSLSTSNAIISSASYIRLNNSTIDYQGASDGSGGYFKTTLDNVNATANRTILLPNISGTLITTADSGTVTASMIGSGEITNTQISNSANISASKIATGVLPSGLQVNSANIIDGSIVDADVNASAAITLTKLGTGTLPSGIQVVDANLNAGISASKVNTGTLGSNVVVTASNYQAGSISNVAINANAEIDVSKLADGGARQLLQTDASGNNVEWASNIDIPGTLDVTGNSVFDGRVTISDVLTVNSTEITLNAPVVNVADKNITLNSIASPSDANASGGGLTVKGTTDKTYSYDNTNTAFTSSENINLASGKTYKVNGTTVLDGTSLGSGITDSSLTKVGTIGTGIWQGSAIVDTYLNTISTSGKVANSATTATSANTPSAIVSRDGSGDITVRNVNGALIGNASTATTLETARTISLTGHISGSASFDGSSNISINTAINTSVTDTNLTWTASTRTLASSTGTDAVITLFDASNAGLTPASGGGTGTFLRADGSWVAVPATVTNLSYTAGTSTLNSSTGTGVSLPDFTDYNSGLTPASGGGTTKFLRADGTWVTIGSGTQGSDLAYVAATRTVTNTNGTGFVLPVSTTSTAGLLSSSDKTKLDGLSAYTDSDAISAVTGSDLDMGGNKVLFANVYSQLGDLPSASTYHGMFAHVHATGKGYFAHAGNWIALATLTNGKLTSSEIPDIAITEYLGVVANQTAMLALTGQKGDWCVRSDDGKVYVITGNDTTQVSSWTALSYPAVATTPWTTSGNDIYYTAGKVGIGSASPGKKLAVVSSAWGQAEIVGPSGSELYFASAVNGASDGIISYNHTSDSMNFYTTGSNRLTISSSGNVGIGTTASSTQHLGTGFKELMVSGDTLGAGIELSDTDGNVKLSLFTNDSVNYGCIRTITNHPLTFRTNNTERLRIDSSGNLLIGFTSGSANGKLQVAGGIRVVGSASPSDTSSPYIYRTSGADNLCISTSSSERLRIDSSGRLFAGTTTAGGSSADDFTIATSGQTGITIRSGTSSGGQIHFSDGTSGADQERGIISYQHGGNYMRFYTDATERLRIDSSGNLLVGLTSAVGISGTPADLNSTEIGRGYINISRDDTQAADHIQFGKNGSVAGSIGTSTTNSLTFKTGTTERLRIDSSGMVDFQTGIFGDNPSDNFTLNGRTQPHYGFNLTPQTGVPVGFSGYRGIAFATNGVERARLDSSGDLGLGVSPDNVGSMRTLHIKGPSSEGAAIRLQADGDTPGSSDAQIYKNSAALYLRVDGTDPLIAYLNGSERMRLDSSGRLLIGHTSASNTAPLQVTTATSGAFTAQFRARANNDYSFLAFSSHDATEDLTQIGVIRSSANNGSFVFYTNGGNTSSSERLRILSDGTIATGGLTATPSTVAAGSYIQHAANAGFFGNNGDAKFGSSANNPVLFQVNGSEKMRIDSSGNVVVGGSSANAHNAVSVWNDGHIFINRGSGYGLIIQQNGGGSSNDNKITLSCTGDGTFAGNVNAYSDVRLKKDIKIIDNALDKVSAIRGVTFDRIDQDDEKRQAGVIAQEIEAVLPEVVSTNSDGIKSVAYGNIVGLLIEAVKELKSEVEILKAK